MSFFVLLCTSMYIPVVLVLLEPLSLERVRLSLLLIGAFCECLSSSMFMSVLLCTSMYIPVVLGLLVALCLELVRLLLLKDGVLINGFSLICDLLVSFFFSAWACIPDKS